MNAQALSASIAICLAAAALEGACAGRHVKRVLETLRSPRHSPPFPVWIAIGLLYYVTFGFILYRLVALPAPSGLSHATIALVIGMMIANALWNLIFFRFKSLFAAFVTGSIAPIPDLALLWCSLRLDTTMAWALLPYLAYRAYAVWWGYALWRLNGRPPDF